MIFGGIKIRTLALCLILGGIFSREFYFFTLANLGCFRVGPNNTSWMSEMTKMVILCLKSEADPREKIGAHMHRLTFGINYVLE